MAKFERGKRVKADTYDDACRFTDEEMNMYREMLNKNSIDTDINIFNDRFWIHGNNDSKFIVPSPSTLHDKITAEEQSKIIDELNSIGCTSFMITSEEIKKLLGGNHEY